MSEPAIGRRDTLGHPDGRPQGLIRATVADNADPSKRGRLKLIIPEVSGPDSAHPEWAEPALGFGKGSGKVWGSTFGIPEIGDVVGVLFRHSEPGAATDAMVWFPGWCIKDAMPALLLTHYPKRRGLVTPSGHSFYFDDSDGGDGEVVLRQRDGTAEVRLTPDKVKLAGGGRRAAGEGHAVQVTIPAGTVVVGVTGGGGSPAVAVMNPSPITLDGDITEGETAVEIPG